MPIHHHYDDCTEREGKSGTDVVMTLPSLTAFLFFAQEVTVVVCNWFTSWNLCGGLATSQSQETVKHITLLWGLANSIRKIEITILYISSRWIFFFFLPSYLSKK